MIAILILVEKIAPKAPAPLVAVAAGIAAAYLLSLEARGIRLVGKIPKGLPPVTVPDLSLIFQLWPGALGIALMEFHRNHRCWSRLRQK
jgi:sulfate permease, SulP family